MDPESITRSVAKWLVDAFIAAKVAEITANTVTDRTNFEKDSLAVKLGSGAVGMVVSKKLDPYTSKMVDKTADFVVAHRSKIRFKKTPQSQEK